MRVMQDADVMEAAKQVEATILPRYRPAYDRVIGTALDYAKKQGPEGFKALLAQEDLVAASGKLGANMVLLFYKMSTGSKIPLEVLAPAAMVITLEALDLLGKAGKLDPTKEDIARAARAMMDQLMPALGWNEKSFDAAAKQVNDIMRDPVKMEAINRRGGVVKDPRASTPTEVPPEETAPLPGEEPLPDEEAV